MLARMWNPQVIALTTLGRVLVAGLVVSGCAGTRSRAPIDVPPGPEALGERIEAESPPADAIGANLFLILEGGFLEERELKLNAQLLTTDLDRLRLIGSYGAFKKVFDLAVVGDGFGLLDHREGILYRGPAWDADVAARLGFAARPGDLARLFHVGGLGPMRGAEIGDVRAEADSARVEFRVPGDSEPWRASLDGELRVVGIERGPAERPILRVRYDRYFRASGRWVPRRVRAARLAGDERVTVELRSIRFPDHVPPSQFVPPVPEGVLVEDLSPG
jgi:hypothetical protein